MTVCFGLRASLREMLYWKPSRALFGVAGLALLITACGESSEPVANNFPEDAIAIRASSDLGVGEQRLLVGVATADGTRLGSPDDPVMFEVAPLDTPDNSQTVAATFTWMLEPVVGLYRAEVDFDEAGSWQVTVIPDAGDPLEPVPFNVFAEPFTPIVGSPAPLPPTPTLGDFTIEQLTTDDEPDPRFYELSLQEAVATGDPTVVVFSTPAYCQTSACGPLLDIVKESSKKRDDVNFVHVEVFTGLDDPDFAPDAEHLAPAVTEDWYNLPSEPWVFVIDASGLIAARFEGVMDASELEAILAKISV